jgi:nitrite reductase/ring-hydroxylating ferredoxin subunit
MSQAEGPPPGPDFTAGIPLVSIPPGGVLAGRVGDEAVLLARLDDGVHAVAAHCTHYGGPLAEGLIEGDEIRCPWHHACFSLRTGRARHAPAFAPLAKWRVDTVGDTVFVRDRDTTPPPARARPGADPRCSRRTATGRMAGC